jgi:hypothetical protein
MKLFQCQSCGQVIHFENRSCENCGRRLGYLPGTKTLSALDQNGAAWRALAQPDRPQRFCANAEADVCNWLVDDEDHQNYCIACRHNRTIPNQQDPANLLAWKRIEEAKRRLFYELIALNLAIETRQEAPDYGLMFDFLADDQNAPKVMTGHDNGLITIALAEADDAEREARRTSMGEPYRTLLGHFRHEVGHYYWDRLVRDQGHKEATRAVFGDDREDYGEALQRYYENGPRPNWGESFVSTYACMHPWEDFAETWAHYLHIVDTLEMAAAFDVRTGPSIDMTGALASTPVTDPFAAQDFRTLINAWIPLTFALNGLNRCMGLADIYPFVLSPAVIAKLSFIHELVHGRAPKDKP